MCSGPKSAWKALYSKLSSMEKYTGGWTLGPLATGAGVGPLCDFEERLCAVRVVVEGYGNGVATLGGWV